MIVGFIRANEDKPHRCPNCWRIPERGWKSRPGRFGTWQSRLSSWLPWRCDRDPHPCGLVWWRGWRGPWTGTTRQFIPERGIFQMLDLSTAHLPYELRERLSMYPGVIADERVYGWLLWVPEDVEAWIAEITEGNEGPPPAELVAIRRYASTRDCQYVLFDSGGPTNPDLPTFEGE